MAVTEVKAMVISLKRSLKCMQMKTNISHTVSCKEPIGFFVMKTTWMKLLIEAVHGPERGSGMRKQSQGVKKTLS